MFKDNSLQLPIFPGTSSEPLPQNTIPEFAVLNMTGGAEKPHARCWMPARSFPGEKEWGEALLWAQGPAQGLQWAQWRASKVGSRTESSSRDKTGGTHLYFRVFYSYSVFPHPFVLSGPSASLPSSHFYPKRNPSLAPQASHWCSSSYHLIIT